ncbi:MAG: hypothetical protein P8Z77_16770, partial [Candidatus Thiodiazotropha sp.]
MRLKNKIVLTLAGLFACHFVVQGYLDYRQITSQALADLREQAAVARQAMALLPEGSWQPALLARTVAEWVQGEQSVEFISLAQSDDSEQMAEPVIRFFEANPDKAERVVLVELPEQEDYYHLTLPYPATYATASEPLMGVLSIRFSASGVRADVASALRQSLLIHGLGMLMVFLITAWLINRILLAPIKRLTTLVNGLAGDESEVSAHLTGDRELEEVSQRFEQMAG